MRIEGSTAFKSALRNKSRKYPDRKDSRYSDHLILPAINPSFSIPQGSSVFTIGSCFAREVEDSLQKSGVSVPTASFSAPKEEAPGRPNRVLNQYNPGTMLQCIQAAGREADTKALYNVPGSDLVLDSLLSTGNRPVSAPRALERRNQINKLYNQGLATADTVIITLGLIESWYDHQHQIYLNEVPPRQVLEQDHARFEFRRMSVAECLTLMTNMIAACTADRARHILLTVSPVPLQVTFTGGCAVTANAYSKAILRIVADQVAQMHGCVDYFPSYEIVTTAGLPAFGEDNVHVRPMIVNRIIAHMLNHYLESPIGNQKTR